MYDYLKNLGVVASAAKEIYSVQKINDTAVAAMLKKTVEDSCFFVQHLSFDEHRNVFEYVESYLDGSFYKLEVNLERK